jgi:hypothetical protein
MKLMSNILTINVPAIDSRIRTDQKNLFHNGYVTDSPMAEEEAVT